MKNFTVIFLLLLIIACSCKKEDIVKPEILPLEISINDLETKLKPIINLSAGEYTANSLLPNDTLYALLDNPLSNIMKFYDNIDTLIFKCELREIKIKSLHDNQMKDDLVYKIKPTNDTIAIDLVEKLEADRSFELQFDFVYREKIDGKWQDVILQHSDKAVTTIYKKFNSSKLSDDVYTLSISTIDAIKGISLKNNVFPFVSFNYPLDKELRITKDGHKSSTIRPTILESSITEKNGNPINISFQWTSPVSMSIFPENPYKSFTTYLYVIKVGFEEKVGDKWLPLIDDSDQLLFSEHSHEFTTGDYSQTLIPDAFISATYPLERQFNFYLGEYDKGYIELRYDALQLEQITSIDNLEFHFYQLPDNMEVAVMPARYTSIDKTFWFDLPNSLQKETPYRIQLVANTTVIYKNEFRVSKYEKLTDKLPDQLSVRFYYNDKIEGIQKGYDVLGATIYTSEADECFDYYEIIGQNNTPLIRRTALLEQWDWYNNSIYKYLYDNHPVVPNSKLTRDLSKASYPPIHAIDMWQVDYNKKLTDDEINTGQFKYEPDLTHIVNALPKYWAMDYTDAYNAVRSFYRSDSEIKDPYLKKIYGTHLFPTPSVGDYSVKFEYVLPGKNIVTTTHVITIENNIEINDTYWYPEKSKSVSNELPSRLSANELELYSF